MRSKINLMRRYSLVYVTILTALALTIPNPNLKLEEKVKPVVKSVDFYVERKFSEESPTHRFAFSSGLTLFLAKMGYTALFMAGAGVGTVAWFFDIAASVRYARGVSWLLDPRVLAVFLLEFVATVEANALSWFIFFSRLRREVIRKQAKKSLTAVTLLMAVATAIEAWYLGLPPVPL